MAGPFELQIRKFAELAKDNADQVVRKVVIDVYSELILRSPVDTGRFRANWLYGDSRPQYRIVPTTGTTESPTPAPDAPEVAGEALGKVHFITNGLPYARRLEYGWSKQAPAGLVGLTTLRFNEFITKAVNEVNP